MTYHTFRVIIKEKQIFFLSVSVRYRHSDIIHITAVYSRPFRKIHALQDYADNLIFENEHQFGTKPMGIDVIIIKKQTEIPVRKNIGRIFRKYNIIEYKDPGDCLSIDDWYKVYGYCYFYKADTGSTDSIKIDEMTISPVCEHYPRKLFPQAMQSQFRLLSQANYHEKKIYG